MKNKPKELSSESPGPAHEMIRNLLLNNWPDSSKRKSKQQNKSKKTK